MTKRHDPEFKAMRVIVKAMSGLSREAQKRAFVYIWERFMTLPSRVVGAASTPPTPPHDLHVPAPPEETLTPEQREYRRQITAALPEETP